jgi:hypothetical protein
MLTNRCTIETDPSFNSIVRPVIEWNPGQQMCLYGAKGVTRLTIKSATMGKNRPWMMRLSPGISRGIVIKSVGAMSTGVEWWWKSHEKGYR